MKIVLAPSALATAPNSDVTSGQEYKVQDDQNTLLPARTKRKFQVPASIDIGRTAAIAGVSKRQVCKTVPPAKPDPLSEQSGVPAQYFSVLYTKRAANKVNGFVNTHICALLAAFPKLYCFQAEEEKQVISGWHAGGQARQFLHPLQ